MQTTETQLALLIQKVEHIAEGMDELKPLASLVLTLQKDQEHSKESIKQLNTIAEMRGATQHLIDKRVLVLERWHKFMLAVPAFLLTASLGFLNNIYDFKEDTSRRITSLEFIINSPHFERSMITEKEVPAGGNK